MFILFSLEVSRKLIFLKMGYSFGKKKKIFQSLLRKEGSNAKFSDSVFFNQIEYCNLSEISLKFKYLIGIWEYMKQKNITVKINRRFSGYC